MAEHAAPHSLSTPGAVGVVGATVWCGACNYVLDGLPRTSVCPECGSAARIPSGEPLLRNAPHAYLQRVTLGLQLVTTSVVVMVAAGVLTAAALIFAQRTPQLIILFGQTAMCCGLGLHGAGLWLLASSERGPGGAPLPDATLEISWARLVTRLCGAAGAVGAIGSLALLALPDDAGAGVGAGAGSLTGMVTVLAIVFGAWSAMSHGATIAARIPNDALRHDLRVMRWVLPAVAVVGVVALFTGPAVAAGIWWWLINRLRIGVEGELRAARGAPDAGIPIA